MSGHDNSEHGELGHIVPFKVYLAVCISLMVLTVITVVVAETVDVGSWNIVVAMLIASVKASLVALFFMHLKFEDPITWLYAGFPIVLLFLLMGGIFLDNPTRMEVKPVEVVDTLKAKE